MGFFKCRSSTEHEYIDSKNQIGMKSPIQIAEITKEGTNKPRAISLQVLNQHSISVTSLKFRVLSLFSVWSPAEPITTAIGAAKRGYENAGNNKKWEREPRASCMKVNNWKNFWTKLAQQPAIGPVWMPQALKPLCLVHFLSWVNSLFSLLALWGNKNWPLVWKWKVVKLGK